ncbi:hypothetical protein Lser_V15G23799 [Lactuca serriola]
MRWEDSDYASSPGTPSTLLILVLIMYNVLDAWKIDDTYHSFSSQLFKIRYARYYILLSVMIAFNSSQVNGRITSVVILKFELLYTPVLEIGDFLEVTPAAIHEFRISPKPLLGLHSYCPIHFDDFHVVLINTIVYISLLKGGVHTMKTPSRNNSLSHEEASSDNKYDKEKRAFLIPRANLLQELRNHGNNTNGTNTSSAEVGWILEANILYNHNLGIEKNGIGIERFYQFGRFFANISMVYILTLDESKGHSKSTIGIILQHGSTNAKWHISTFTHCTHIIKCSRTILSYAILRVIPPATTKDYCQPRPYVVICFMEIANVVHRELEKAMSAYGFEIVQTLNVDIEPYERVKKAMNEIKIVAWMRLAAIEKCEVEKILQIKRAKGESESKYLSRLGVAQQRQTIVDGLRDSVLGFSVNVPRTTAKDVMDMVLVTPYFDTMKEVDATSKSSAVFIPHVMAL